MCSKTLRRVNQMTAAGQAEWTDVDIYEIAFIAPYGVA